MISQGLTIFAALSFIVFMVLPLGATAYDTYWGYFVCYDQNSRGSVGSCQLSTAICDSRYLHHYGQYNNRDEWQQGLLRCHNAPATKVDPVARMWLK